MNLKGNVLKVMNILQERNHKWFDHLSDPLLSYQRYVDVMLSLAEYQGFQYHAIIHSDLDTFLMPGFASWTQPNPSILIVGHGGYGSENANYHLKFVSKELGLNITKGLNGLGSTWFGESKLMAATARLTIEVMRWLNTQVQISTQCCSQQMYRPFDFAGVQ